MKWTIRLTFAALLWLARPLPPPCATPTPLTMPTAASGRPMDARPTYSPALAMPGGRP